MEISCISLVQIQLGSIPTGNIIQLLYNDHCLQVSLLLQLKRASLTTTRMLGFREVEIICHCPSYLPHCRTFFTLWDVVWGPYVIPLHNVATQLFAYKKEIMEKSSKGPVTSDVLQLWRMFIKKNMTLICHMLEYIQKKISLPK